MITPIMGEAMGSFLNALPGDKPFCLSVSLNTPHGSQTTSMYEDYEDWRKMTRPANENPALQGTPYYDTLYRDIDIQIPEDTATDPYRYIPQFILDQDKGRKTQTYQYSYTRATNLEHHIRYYQTITGIDHTIGQFLKELEQRGLMDNTVIVYGSDHGLLMGEYGMGGKSLLYDSLFHLRSARAIRPARQDYGSTCIQPRYPSHDSRLCRRRTTRVYGRQKPEASRLWRNQVLAK